MTTAQATAEVFFRALEGLSAKEQLAFLGKLLHHRKYREDLMDLAILESRRHESSNGPFKPIPKFKNEDEERKFWATHDTTKYVDWKSARRVRFPNLKPASKRRHRAA